MTNTIQIDESETSNIEIEFRYKTSKSKNDSVAILLHNIFPTQDINQKSQYLTDEINLPCDDKWSTYHNVIAGRKGYKIYSFAVENKSTERIWLDDFRISINGKQCKKYVFFSEKDYQKLQSEIEPIDIVQLNEHQFESLSKGIQDKKLVTLGESTHGTKEVNLIKNAIIKQLVKKHNFNYIIFEGNMGSLEDANNFLLNDPINGVEKALSKLFAVFQTKEVEELFTWIQKYNISKPLRDKIQLKGCDIQDEIDVLDKLMKFAKRTDSDLESLLSLFSKEYKVPERLDLIMKIKNRLAKIEANNNKIYRNEIQYGNLLEQFVIKDANIGLPGYRDSCMASNIKWILDSGPKIKAIFWAHNIHVQKQFVAAPGMNDEVKSKGIKLTTGQFLDDLIPSQQFVVGFALNEGTYRAKIDLTFVN